MMLGRKKIYLAGYAVIRLPVAPGSVSPQVSIIVWLKTLV